MSYDLDVKITRVIHSDNYTYNVYKMYDRAWDKIQEELKQKEFPNYILDECIHEGKWRTAIQLQHEYSVIVLNLMIKEMERNPEEYKKLNPKNGWGNYEGALKFLKNAYDALLISEQAYITLS